MKYIYSDGHLRYIIFFEYFVIKCLYLLIKLIDDALGPLEVQVTDFGWSIDIC